MRLLTSSLVRPLEDDWRDSLDGVAAARGWPTSKSPARLAAEVAKLKATYNDEAGSASDAPSALPRARALLPARLGFSFARDVPKGAGAARELVAAGLIAKAEGRPLRVLDLGAGLGASTWGLARALASLEGDVRIDATWVDDDADALDVAVAIVRARAGRGAIGIEPRVVRQALDPWLTRLSSGPRDRDASHVRERYDVILLGQVLSELDRPAASSGDAGGARVARHVELVRVLVEGALESHGSLIVIEPALRERTRHLHQIRDAVLAARVATLFAPCLHEEACPALAHPGDWCHEDLGVDLPGWLVPVAKGAGLRWQGLTFSYLVLRRDGRSLRDSASAHGAKVRVVSGPIVTKGKREAFVCGDLARDGARVVGRVRAMRLDRERTAANAAWDEAARGEVLLVDPPLDAARARVGRETRLDPAPVVASHARAPRGD